MRGIPSKPASDDFVDDRTPPGGRCRYSARPDLRHVCTHCVRKKISPTFLLQVVGGWWVVRASRTCDPKPNGRNWRTRAANAVRRVLGDMGQGGAGERAGWCCVRGDRRTRAVYGDDARESPADEAHGECGARGHAARARERGSAPLILGSVARGVGIPGFPIVGASCGYRRGICTCIWPVSDSRRDLG